MDASASAARSQGVEVLSASSPVITKSALREVPADLERPGKRARIDGLIPMTAAAAVAEARQQSKSPKTSTLPSTKTSPNPANQALSALLGGDSQNLVSKAGALSRKPASTDATNKISEGLALAVEHLQPPSTEEQNTAGESQAHTSPTSTTSYDAHDSVTAPSGMGTTVASPQPLENSPQPTATSGSVGSTSPENTSKAFSYPTPLLQPLLNDTRRGMSLPHSGIQRRNTRSPSNRKHQCTFCNTEFTRHHNLKSHLLTHSQEKPYVCSTCNSRFRRLHDLKRHTKLHTGERPHVCPQCKRKFARGDALARHNKGPGGCAGRRASMGDFAGDDDIDGDDSMEGVMYNEPESIEDADEGAVRATPSIRRQAPSGDDTMEDSDQYSRIPSTYPPIQGRPPGGIASGNFPPRPSYGPISAAPAVGGSHNHGAALLPAGSAANLRPSNHGSVFAPNSITESPKAISPRQPHRGSTDARMHSPNLPQFQPPSQFGRSMSGSGPGLGSQSSGPQLPPPHVLNPPGPQYTLASQSGPTHPPTQPSGPPTHMSGSGPLSSHSNSLSSHGHSGPGSADHTSSMFNKEDRLWAYVKDLEGRMNQMQDEINNLKSQLATPNASSSQQIRG